MKNMEIREMKEQEITEVFNIAVENFDEPWSERSIIEDFNNVLSRYFVYIENSQIIGYISFWYIINEAHITNIVVKNEMRGQGIGKKLIEALIKFAEENDMIGLTLEVSTKNERALGLYKKYGFTITGTRPEYYEKSKDDAYILWKNM